MSIPDIIIEPVGSSKPKFSSNLDLSAFKKSQGQGVALTCPAQGSPSPGFRYFLWTCELKSFSEPIGSSKPKFSTILKMSAFQKQVSEGLALTCPAQGSPVPAFR